MPERDGYAPGTPSWVDLATPDVDNAARFYGELFGWETQETGTIEETGGYRFFLSGGKQGRRRQPADAATASPSCGRPTSPPTTSTRSPSA